LDLGPTDVAGETGSDPESTGVEGEPGLDPDASDVDGETASDPGSAAWTDGKPLPFFLADNGSTVPSCSLDRRFSMRFFRL
jgi:hypothetical protein